MNAEKKRFMAVSAAWLLRLSGWFCVWLVLPVLGRWQEADSRGQPDVPPLDKILATLRPEHPRVMAVPATFDAIRASVRGGGLPARIYAEVKQSADQTLAAPVSKYEIPDGKRLLSVSRRVLDRVRTLALVYRMEGDPRYADRAWKELEAAAAFPDWNPPHFLDTAEMTHAFALGYDWLYERWSAGSAARVARGDCLPRLTPGPQGL